MDNLKFDKYFLLRKISVIYAIKCNKGISFLLAIDSFKELNKLKKLLEESLDSELTEVNEDIFSWKNHKFITIEEEFFQLLKNKQFYG